MFSYVVLYILYYAVVLACLFFNLEICSVLIFQIHCENSKSSWNLRMINIQPGLSYRIVCLDIDQNLIRNYAFIIPIISSTLDSFDNEFFEFSNKRGVIKWTFDLWKKESFQKNY